MPGSVFPVNSVAEYLLALSKEERAALSQIFDAERQGDKIVVPETVSPEMVSALVAKGMLRRTGSRLVEMTSRGKAELRKIILSDEVSTFEKGMKKVAHITHEDPFLRRWRCAGW